jgi:hypothetical protein
VKFSFQVAKKQKFSQQTALIVCAGLMGEHRFCGFGLFYAQKWMSILIGFIV